MYQDFFALNAAPFTLSPDPHYLYLSPVHREALQQMHRTIASGGVMTLVGAPGTGKTTLGRHICLHAGVETETAYMIAPLTDHPSLLEQVCRAFHLPDNTLLEPFLRQTACEQKQAVLLIDEAQHLTVSQLEALCALTNIETDKRKLLSIILLGQPELEDRLRAPGLLQLRQRITAGYFLNPLSAEDIDAAVRFRLQQAGCLHPLFSRKAIEVIARVSRGIPRIVNQLCESMLVEAARDRRWKISASHAGMAAHKVCGRVDTGGLSAIIIFALACVMLAIGGGFGWQQWGWLPQPEIKTVNIPVWIAPDKRLQQQFDAAVNNARNQQDAFSLLLSVWGYENAGEAPLCEAVLSAGLKCYRSFGDLNQIVALNYPAVVQLKDKTAGSWFAVLSHVANGKASLFFAHQEWEVSLDWLTPRLQKDATLIWRLPDSGALRITSRSPSQDIQWIAQRLSSALKMPVPEKAAKVQGAIAAFQAQQHLPTDGIAGEQTLMRLSNQPDQNLPTLDGIIPAREYPATHESQQVKQ
ncbi:MAG: ExeA family protein [Silvania sp.]|uniref:ExeA family protein n=1 Tax=Silvania sp. TaxID=3016633 RepID=UPI003EE43AED